MKKRLISMLLSATMIASVLPPISIFAAGTSSDGLVAAESISADVDSAKFTYNEWRGTRYTDLAGNQVNGEDVFGIEREDASVPRIPYRDAEQAAEYGWNYNVREDSPYFKLLTGKNEHWSLTVVQNDALAEKFYTDEENNFMQADYVEDPADGWKDITLPMSWTMQGFDFSIYSNITMPWQTRYDPNVQCPQAPVVYNPVGLYRKDFEVDETFLNDGRRVYISFQGVESAYYVYINGKEVGYSEDSYSPHRFDITDYLTVGKNFLAVKVHKFCDGTWYEDQDMLYDGGIFRDIYLTSEPVVKIEDYHYTTDLDENFEDAVLTVSADVRNLSSKAHEGWTIDVLAIDTTDKVEKKDILNGEATIAVGSVASTETTTVTASFNVDSPKLWSDEKPNLYTLVLVLKDGDGKVVEVLSTQLGFREFNFTPTQVDETGRNITTQWTQPTINGKRLLILGANRHDSDPTYGKATRQEVINMDFEILKQNNFNAFRTSHYSNDEYFYWKANQIGAYIMAETNLECHNINGNSGLVGLFREIMLDRTETTFKRLRNNPAIFSWSLGNESSYINGGNYNNGNFAERAFYDVIQYFKNNDSTRMVHYEGMNDPTITFGVDMYSDMYRSPEESDKRGQAGMLPYIQCEYAHSMGNSTGDLNGWYQAWLRNPNAMGGFIWDFVDQARAAELEEVYSITDKKGVKGTAVDSGEIWKTGAGEGSLNGGYSTTSGFNFQASKYNQALSGTGKTFTVEVVTKPTSRANNQVFVTKGDNQFALKTQPNTAGLEFTIFYGGVWNSVNVNFPADWENNWHQIVGVYDKGNMKLYVDGELAGQETFDDNIASSTVPVGVGYDASTGRTQNGEISIARIYTTALSAEQIAAQNSANPAIGPDDDNVLLWVDYSDDHFTATEGWDYFSESYAHVTDLYADEMKGKYMAYGGDWGDYPNDGNYPQNGLVSADRTLQSDMYNAKGVYKRIEFSAANLDNKQFTVKNYMYWTNLNEYDVEWRVYDNGTLYKTGDVGAIDLAPQATKTITVPFELPEAQDGHEYYVDLVVKQKAGYVDWAEEGYEQHHQQFQVLAPIDQVPQTINKSVNVNETDTAYEISGDKFNFSISKADGRIKNYTYDGDLLIEDGPAASFWRCRTDNDKGSFDANWMNKDQTIRVDGITVGTSVKGLPVITATIKFPNAGQTTETIRYTVNGNGEITVDVSVNGNGSGLGNFLRVGTTSVIPAGFEDVTWYGLGPWDTFADKKDYATQGIWTNTVSRFFFPFESIDDCGTMLDTAWIALKNEDVDTALLVASKDRIEVSAMHFTAYDLETAQHPYELTPRDETILALNYGSLGIGTASLGRGPISSTHLPSNRVYEWNFTFIPVPANSTNEELSKASLPYHEAASRYDADREVVNDIKDRIDTFVVDSYKNKIDAANKLVADIEALTDDQRAMLGEEYIQRANEILEEVKAFEDLEIVIEAEDGTNNTGEIRTNNPATHSGGKYVGGWDNGGSATYTFTSAAAGEAVMQIYGCSAQDRALVVTINGQTLNVNTVSTGSWDSTNGAMLGTVTIPVVKGENTMIVGGPAAANAPNVDYFLIPLPKADESTKWDISFSNMTLGNNLAMSFAFAANNEADWSGHYVEIVKTYADGRDDVVKTVAFKDWTPANINSTAHYYVTFDGVAAKEMSDNVSVTVYNADGVAVSNVYTMSVRAYAMKQLAAGKSDELNTTIVDMLNYGAASQKYLGYNLNDLANNQLTDAQKAMATESVSCTNSSVGSSNYRGTNLKVESNILLQMAFSNVDQNMRAVISFTDHSGRKQTIDVAGSEFEKVGNYYVVTVDGLVVADGRQLVTVQVYNGNTLVAEASDSMEGYCARSIEKGGNNVEVFEMLMKFSDSAYTYFH